MKAGRASATAEFVAQGTLFLSRDPRLGSLVPEQAADVAERCLSASAPAKLALTRLASGRLLRRLGWKLERAVFPGIFLHHALRKRFIEECARAVVGPAEAQLVVLGAGFDSLAPRVAASQPWTSCIEIDHPATQERKRQGLGAMAPPNLELVDADLGQETAISALLRARLFSRRRPTFVVFEGISMYLDEESVVSALRVAPSLGKGTRMAWTYMTPDTDGTIGFRRSRTGWVNAWLASKGEPFSWGIARAQLPDLLARCGLRVLEVVDAGMLRSRYLSSAQAREPLAEGEEICLCEVP